MTTARLTTVRLPLTLALIAAVVATGQLLMPAGTGPRLYLHCFCCWPGGRWRWDAVSTVSWPPSG